MYSRPLLPHGHEVPEGCTGAGFRLRPLRLTDAEKDYEAVMASADRLKGFMDPESDWPEGLTLHENRVDLGWHEREFTLGHSFAWTVVTPDETSVIGCCYLYPSDREGYDAMAFWWLRDGWARLDGRVGSAFRTMLDPLPLKRLAWPGRRIAWGDWQRLARIQTA